MIKLYSRNNCGLAPCLPERVSTNVGHFGCGHFGLGRFGPDISATDVSATENTKGGRFGHNHKLWVVVDSIHVFSCICGFNFLGLTVNSILPVL